LFTNRIVAPWKGAFALMLAAHCSCAALAVPFAGCEAPAVRVGIGLVAAVLAISTAAVAVRLAEPLSAEVVACLRVSVTALGLYLVTARATGRAVSLLRAAPREAALTLLAGLCLAAHFAAWIASLSLTTVVRSVALVSTQPLFAGIFARALGDRALPRLYIGTAVAVVGTLVMIEPGADASEGSWVGDLLALSGAVTAAVYLAIGRRVHQRLGDQLPVEGYFVCVNLVAAAALGLLVLGRGAELAPIGVEWSDYAAIVWMGLIPGIVGHGLLNWAVRHMPVHTVSLAVLLEPAGAAFVAWLLLGDVPGGREVIGAGLLIVGVALGLPRRSAPAS
jgi:drug/metabolite transporter (DMT)-like permease